MGVSKSIAFSHLLHKFISASSLHCSHKILLGIIIHRKASTTTLYPSVETVKAIRVHKFGGPEVLKWEDVELGEPNDGEIRVKNNAIGLNFFDAVARKREYKVSKTPFILGCWCGNDNGPRSVLGKVGDYVAYVGPPTGTYAEEQICHAPISNL